MDIPLTDLFAKARVYIKDPNDAPTGTNVQRGPQGGYYYDDAGKGGEEKEQEQGAAPQEQEQQLMEPEEWENVDAVQQQATNIMENNQGIPEEGTPDRDALNQMVARMSELTGQDPHEIASELTQQMEEAFGGEFREDAVDDLGAGGPELGVPEAGWSNDPRSPSYDVTTQSLSNNVDELLHGRYNFMFHPEKNPTGRKWLERLESNLAEAGYMDTEIDRGTIDRMFEEFVDEQPDGWLWDDRNRREELAEYTDALLSGARDDDNLMIEQNGFDEDMPPITAEEVAEDQGIDYEEDVNRRSQEMDMTPDQIRQMDLDYDEEEEEERDMPPITREDVIADDDMRRRMEETGMSEEAIREMDSEYESDDIADVADDVDEGIYDPYGEQGPLDTSDDVYNEQEEEVAHENLTIEHYHDFIEEEQDTTIENQMKLQAGEMSLEEAGFGPDYDEQSALDFYDDYHVALENYAGMHPNEIADQTPSTVAEQKALEFATTSSADSNELANSEFGYGQFGDKEAPQYREREDRESPSTGIEDTLNALKQQATNNMNQYYESEYPDNSIEGGIGDNEGIKLENIANGVQRVINAIGQNPEADPEELALQVREEQHNEWLRYMESEYPDTVDDYYPDGPIGDPRAIALEAEGSGIQEALREIENINLGG